MQVLFFINCLEVFVFTKPVQTTRTILDENKLFEKFNLLQSLEKKLVFAIQEGVKNPAFI